MADLNKQINKGFVNVKFKGQFKQINKQGNLNKITKWINKGFVNVLFFQVGFDDTGKLIAIIVTITEEAGYHVQEANFVGSEFPSHIDEGEQFV